MFTFSENIIKSSNSIEYYNHIIENLLSLKICKKKKPFEKINQLLFEISSHAFLSNTYYMID